MGSVHQIVDILTPAERHAGAQQIARSTLSHRATRLSTRHKRCATGNVSRMNRGPVPAGRAPPPLARAPRYLRYDAKTAIVVGMNHWLTNLECLMREAYATSRLAVLPALDLSPRHNFGVDREWRWESYVDLGESRLVDADGREHPLPLASRPPDVALPALTLNPGERMPPGAQVRRLVVRRIEHSLYRADVPEADRPPVDVRFRPAPRVRELARPMIEALTARGEGRFTAVHVRRGDRGWKRFTVPACIQAHLKGRGVADRSVVFILSDERAPGFWEPLKEHYDLVRYTDCPRLAGLVSGADGRRPDNYLLYEVEKEIMRSAALRIESLLRAAARRMRTAPSCPSIKGSSGSCRRPAGRFGRPGGHGTSGRAASAARNRAAAAIPPGTLANRMSRPVVPFILAGGAGHRLWPLSRELHPKQFIAFAGGARCCGRPSSGSKSWTVLSPPSWSATTAVASSGWCRR